jgi:CPA2 family monovalent cation:H+ antiporter-2
VERETSLLFDVSIALAVALAAGWIAARLRLSSIVGYVVAGVILSPFTPGFSSDIERIRLIADIGVVLLLFAIGVQFSLSELARVGPRIIVAVLLQTAAVLVLGVWTAMLAGLARDEALYVGAALGISSSVVLVKLLDQRGDVSSEHGRITVAYSILQDLLAVLLIVVLAAVTGEGGGADIAADSTVAVAKTVAFIGVVLFLGLRVIPLVLNQVAQERSRELFFLAIAALCIGTALASEYVGLSLALGAFLAGIIVSESDLSHRVLAELLPTRDVFAVLFFVSVGMFVEPDVLRNDWDMVLALLAVILVARPVVTFGLLRGFGRAPATAILAAGLVVPSGEFSFLLATAGVDEGVLSDDAFGVVLAAAVISIVLSPLIMSGIDRWLARPGKVSLAPEPGAAAPPSRLGRQAVVCGYGHVGQTVARLLGARFTVLVAVDDAREARRCEEDGFEVIEGSLSSPLIIDRMRLFDTRVLIITLADPFTTRLLTERARAINPHLDIVGRAVVPGERERLAKSGMTQTIVDEDEVGYELARYGLQRFGVSSQESLRAIQLARRRL